MFEVPYGQDPYSAIGRYIRENITTIEDIIAVIDINGVETNELFMVDMEEDGYFIWKSDWYEGEENVVLIDFFPVSEAINSSAQPNVLDTNVGDMVSRQAAIDEIRKCRFTVDAIEKIRALPSVQTDIILCKDCKYWRRQTNYAGAPLSFGFCESDDMWRSLYGETYEVSHIDTDDDFYCGFAERREE